MKNWGWLAVLGGLLVLGIGGLLLAGGMMGPGYAMGPGMMYGYGGAFGPSNWIGWLSMGIGMLAFWGLLIGGGILAVRALSGTPGGSERPAADSPDDILRRRLAAGEITSEQYDQLRQKLTTS